MVVEYRISDIGHISCARGACLLGRPAVGCRVPCPNPPPRERAPARRLPECSPQDARRCDASRACLHCLMHMVRVHATATPAGSPFSRRTTEAQALLSVSQRHSGGARAHRTVSQVCSAPACPCAGSTWHQRSRTRRWMTTTSRRSGGGLAAAARCPGISVTGCQALRSALQRTWLAVALLRAVILLAAVRKSSASAS